MGPPGAEPQALDPPSRCLQQDASEYLTPERLEEKCSHLLYGWPELNGQTWLPKHGRPLSFLSDSHLPNPWTGTPLQWADAHTFVWAPCWSWTTYPGGLWWLFLRLLLAGDVEQNPGPNESQLRPHIFAQILEEFAARSCPRPYVDALAVMPPSTGRGTLLTCGDVEENPGPGPVDLLQDLGLGQPGPQM